MPETVEGSTVVRESRVGAPPASTYGAVEAADDTRQAQQTVSNDAPTDVNFNSIVARSQALTVQVLGNGFVAGQERRTAMWDTIAAKVMQKDT